jgi:protocatechuate 3,4-dioxygenase beta subunit
LQVNTGSPNQVSFVAAAPTASSYAVSTGTRIAGDRSNPHTVTVTVADAFGNGVSGLAGQLVADGNDLMIGLFTETGAGIYTASVNSDKIGNHLVSVKLNSTPVPTSGNAFASFIAGAATAIHSRLSVSAGDKPVGDNHLATVSVHDAYANPVAGQLVTIWMDPELTPNQGKFSVITSANGDAVVSFTSQKAGRHTVYAVLGSSTSTDRVPGSGSRSVNFVAGPVSTQHSQLFGTNGLIKLTNNSADPHRATVTVTDQYGNPITDPAVAVAFTLTGLSGAKLSVSRPVALDNNGQASVSIFSSAAGTAKLTATIVTGSVGQPVTNGGASPVELALRFAVPIDPNDINGSGSNTVTQPGSTVTVTNGGAANNVKATPQFKDTKVVKVKAAQSIVSIVKGRQFKISAFGYTAAGKAVKLKWKSSKAKVAKVSSAGTVRARKVGRATITATAPGGLKVKIKVVVVKRATKAKVKKVTVKGVPRKMKVAKVAYAKVTFRSKKIAGAKVVYRSTNKSVLSVDKAGRLLAKKPGKARLVVKAGSKRAKRITITVTK